MKKRRHKGAHLETEKGFAITKSEYSLLRFRLPSLGLAFTEMSRITDFVLPSKRETTKRIRIERVTKSADGRYGLRCFRCFKNHPIKGCEGKHVRQEIERRISSGTALNFILRMIVAFGAPIPYYSKKRWHFHGIYEGFAVTVALDHAVGLGKYSGHYMEIETILPVDSKEVDEALSAISKLARELLGEDRPVKISYRSMLMSTWKHCTATSKPKKLRKAQGSYCKILKKVSVVDTQKVCFKVG